VSQYYHISKDSETQPGENKVRFITPLSATFLNAANITSDKVKLMMEAARSLHLKRRSTIILHGSTSQKTILNFILAVVRT
jgi:hypothetical protein